MIAGFAHAALAICAAVVGSLWEGIPIVAAVWLALRFFPKLGAATRYAVWLCTLAALLVVPVLTVWAIAPHAAVSIPVDIAQPAAAPTFISRAPQSEANHALNVKHTVVAIEDESSAKAVPQPARIDVPQNLAIAVAIVWILAACMRALLLLQDLRELAALRKGATPWSTSERYPIFVSNTIRVPLAVGFLHPAVILPAPLAEELSPKAISAVVAHEAAHLRRFDVWTNAFARLIEIFVVLNPLAWLVVRRLSIEREIACDDWVVARSGGSETFARTLATLASRTCARTPLAAPSALGSRHAVVERIERLLDAAPRRLRPSLSALGAALVFIAIVAFVLRSVSPVFAYAPATANAAGRAHRLYVSRPRPPDPTVKRPGFPSVTSRSGALVCGRRCRQDRRAFHCRKHGNRRFDGRCQRLTARRRRFGSEVRRYGGIRNQRLHARRLPTGSAKLRRGRVQHPNRPAHRKNGRQLPFERRAVVSRRVDRRASDVVQGSGSASHGRSRVSQFRQRFLDLVEGERIGPRHRRHLGEGNERSDRFIERSTGVRRRVAGRRTKCELSAYRKHGVQARAPEQRRARMERRQRLQRVFEVCAVAA
jgi:beta-lactamase regulating signal transducer with metallopeptidase domain